VSDLPMPDDALIRRTGAAFDHSLPTVPEHLSAAAIDAFQWRRADTVLAELLFDSASDDLVGVRGSSSNGRRSFRYAAGEFVIRVHLTEATLIAMVEPPLAVDCRVISGPDGDVAAHRTDELGELVIDVPEFPIRLEIDLPGIDVATPWITG
jgi:hypothetical protein